jgi:CHAT domain-containing protein
MGTFRKIILAGFLFLSFGFNVYSENKFIDNQAKYTNSFLIYFDRANFDKSLFDLFQLIDYYKERADSTNLYKTWSQISIVCYLNKKQYHGEAAFVMASKYKLFADKNYTFLCLAYEKRQNNWALSKKYLCSISEEDIFVRKCKIYLNYWLGTNRYGKNEKLGSELYFKSKAILRELSEQRDTLWFGYASINYYLGLISYDLKQFNEGLYYSLQAKRTYEKLRCYSYEWINSYYYIFLNGYSLNNIDIQRTCINDLNQIFRNGLIKGVNLFYYYKTKGIYFQFNKNYTEAIDALQEAYKYSIAHSYERDMAIHRIVSIYFQLDKYNKVIEWNKRYEGSQDEYYNIIVAYSYLKLGEPHLSDIYINKAIAQLNTKKTPDKTTTICILANYFYESGDYKKAQKYFLIDLENRIKWYGEFNALTAYGYSNIAYFNWTALRDVPKALEYYNREICTLTRMKYSGNAFLFPGISKSVDDEALGRALRNEAAAFYTLSKQKKSKAGELLYLKTSLSYYELALKAVTKHKSALLREDQKLLYTDLINHYYPNIMQVSIDLFEKTGDSLYSRKAFECAEKGKSSLLLSMARGAGARKMGAIPQNLIKKEEYIATSTSKCLQLLNDENSKKQLDLRKIDLYNTELDKMQQQQDILQGFYRKHYPAYYSACFENKVIGIDSLQKLLKPKQVVLQYSLSQKMLVIFLIAKNRFEVLRDSSGCQLFSDINSYRKMVTGFQFSDTRDSAILAFENVANRLYNRLLLPYEKQFAGHELVIIPDDVLNLIPYESLIVRKTKKTGNFNFRVLQYLIKKYPVSYNYSASLFAQTYRTRDGKAYIPKLFAIAPVGKELNMASINKLNEIDIKRDSGLIVPIPGSEEEAKSVNKIFQGKLLFGKDATESEFKKLAGSYNILHIASHGLVNNENSLLSKLMFASEKDSLNDGFLNTYEVYAMQLNAPLVVLSACNTGYGKLYKGEGIISLARGFFLTGTQDVVMTLWSVADKTSSLLMQGFYRHLSGSETINIALQNAKTDYLSYADEITAHPYFWAGYVSIGNPDIKFASPQKANSYGWYFIPVIVVLSGIVVYWRRQVVKTNYAR